MNQKHTITFGGRYGMQTVFGKQLMPNGRTYWWVKCDCGELRLRQPATLRKVKSCGCVRSKPNLTHGKHGSKVYRAWVAMRSRCSNPGVVGFRYWGGRGIKVCKRWESFENFYADMGEPPSSGHSLDRINNDGDYEPKNCRWATRIQQHQNKRNNRFVTINGERKTLMQWHREIGVVSQGTFTARLQHGWPVEKALLTAPIRPGHNRKAKGL